MADGLGLVHAAPPGRDNLQGIQEVVDAVVGQGLPEVTADRVDGPIAADAGADGGLETLELHLVVPVRALALIGGAIGVAEIPGFAGHTSHVGIGEVAHQLANGVGFVDGVGIREHDDLAGQPRQRGIEAGRLAAPLGHALQSHPTRLVALHDGIRAVIRGIRDDDDLQQVGGIVEGERVVDLRGDDVGLVEGRDHQADRGGDVGLSDRARAADRHDGAQQQRIAHQDVGHQGSAAHEERQPHRGHCPRLSTTVCTVLNRTKRSRPMERFLM